MADMPPRKSLAKTWWGERWLEVLEELGRVWPNRLPRGRGYARRGLVVELGLHPGLVEAKVQGTRRTPYRVRIKLRTFSSEEKEKLFAALAKTPLLTAALLRLEMPHELLSVLSREGLSLIPSKPEEFETACSCPDWANPCKHIAAVFYTLTKAIDSDPFNFFLLRGITREEILSRLKLLEEEQDLQETFTPKAEEIARFHEFRSETPFPPIRLPEGAKELIFSLLSDNPVFFSEGDLKEELRRFYRLAAEVEPGLVTDLPSVEAGAEAVYLPAKKKLFVYPIRRILFWRCWDPKEDRVFLPRPGKKGLKRKRLAGCFFDFREAVQNLLWRPLTENDTPALKIYIFLTHLAQELLKKGHFVPQVRVEDGRFALLFRPYFAFPEVRKIFETVVEKAPLSSFLQPGKEGFLPPERVFLSYLTEVLNYLLLPLTTSGEFPRLFYPEGVRPKDPVEVSFWQALSAWLAPLEAPEKKNRTELSFLLKQGRKYWSLSLLVRGRPLAEEFAGLSSEERRELLEVIGLLARTFPVLTKFQGRKGLKDRISLETYDLLGILGPGRALLRALDIPVAVKGKLSLVERIKLKGASRKGPAESAGFLSLDQILDFDLRVALGDKELSLAEVRRLIKEETPLLRLGEEFILLSPEELRRLKRLLEEEKTLSGPKALLAALTEEIELGGESFPFEPPAEVQGFFEEIKKRVQDLFPPSTVQATLRPYQLTGFRWLAGTLMAGFGACLADDMGLGKTLQTICLVAHFLEEGRVRRVLIVAPTTLLGNWEAEFSRFAPKIPVAIYHGPNRRLEEAPVIVTSYGTLRRDWEILLKEGFELVVLDEAQNIKNPEAAQTKAAYAFSTVPYRVALSGTPIENRLLELWSLFRFLNPGLLGSQEAFRRKFARPIEFLADEEARQRLRRAVAPFVLRREKTDPNIAPELPEKIEKDEWCTLTPRQATLYHQVVEESLRRIEESEGIERRGLVLKLLLLLKQICDHPSLYTKHRRGKVEDSGKLLRLIDLLETIQEAGERVLIFSQFRTMGEIITQVVSEHFGERPFFLHGGVSRPKREEMVAAFEKGEGPFVFVLSLKAGGTGLNLVSATHVVHYDLWWNPAVEAQATDRAYRIGQHRRVMVHRLLTRHTLEEKINELLKRKKGLAESIVSAGEKWITELSNEELRQLVSLEKLS